MGKVIILNAEDMRTAERYCRSECAQRDIEGNAFHRYLGVLGEMVAQRYFEQISPSHAVIPVGLVARMDMGNDELWRAGDILLVRAGECTVYEVKAAADPDLLYRIKRYDAERYNADGVDQVVFIHLNVLPNSIEGEVYHRALPAAILDEWDVVRQTNADGHTDTYMIKPEQKITRNAQYYAARHRLSKDIDI